MFARLLLVLCLVVPTAAEANRTIAAVVNDEVVTNTEVDGRLRLALLGSGIQPSEAVLNNLREQVLRSLIDESLQMQEAKRLGISVPESDVDKQIAALAKQNNMPPDQLPAFFARAGVPVDSLRGQMRTGLTWAKVVQRQLRPQIAIGDSDVDAEIERLNATIGQPEYLAAEIFLAVDSPEQEGAVKRTAEGMIAEMARGARFSVIARQFSQSAGAANGGDLGWITEGQLSPQLDEALRQLPPGGLSKPVRSAAGYHILLLREKRISRGALGVVPSAEVAAAPQPVPAAAAVPAEATFQLRQLLLPLPKRASEAEVKATATQLEAIKRDMKSCADVERMAKATGDSKGGDLGSFAQSKLPPAIKAIVESLPDNQPSQLLRNERGALFVMVCSRTAPASVVATAPAAAPAPKVGDDVREQIINLIGGQKLELLARRYLRDLRQNAFVEVRG